MKKALCVLLVLALVGAAAYAAIDLSGMSFEELLDLRAQVDAALWASDGWQEVIVPQGVYTVGEDIPAGKWTINANYGDLIIQQFVSPEATIYKYFDLVDYGENLTVNLQEGWIVKISTSKAVFTPYTGAALGFK